MRWNENNIDSHCLYIYSSPLVITPSMRDDVRCLKEEGVECGYVKENKWLRVNLLTERTRERVREERTLEEKGLFLFLFCVFWKDFLPSDGKRTRSFVVETKSVLIVEKRYLSLDEVDVHWSVDDYSQRRSLWTTNGPCLTFNRSDWKRKRQFAIRPDYAISGCDAGRRKIYTLTPGMPIVERRTSTNVKRNASCLIVSISWGWETECEEENRPSTFTSLWKSSLPTTWTDSVKSRLSFAIESKERHFLAVIAMKSTVRIVATETEAR